MEVPLIIMTKIIMMEKAVFYSVNWMADFEIPSFNNIITKHDIDLNGIQFVQLHV